MTGSQARRRLPRRAPRTKAVRPLLEGLENRFLLYATTGTQWAKPKRITYSFVPDGTNIGGVPSNLQATLNSQFPTADWKLQFAMAAAVWQKVANVNFYQVSDNGASLGASGAQQSDSRFGDVRIGGYAMSGSILAFAYLAPPANGGTYAGDMLFNTSASWQINGTTYDLLTVAIHEFGHAIGMGHSALSTASMYPAYNSIKQAATTDDVSGVRSIYNSRQNDFFDANGANNRVLSADQLSSYIDSNKQLTISALDSTTPVMIGQGDLDWYKVTVPAGTTGTMVVRMQSTDLSLLAPTLAVYNSTGTTKLGERISYTMGDTATVTINGVTPGQVYSIRASGTGAGDSGFGAYGLQVNFGSLTQPPVTAPDTYMAEMADQGGGTMSQTAEEAETVTGSEEDRFVIAGVPTFWVYDDYSTTESEDDYGTTVSEDAGIVGLTATDEPSPEDPEVDPSIVIDTDHLYDGEIIQVGDLSGIGDAVMMDGLHYSRAGSPGGVAPWTPRWRPPQPRGFFSAGLSAKQPTLDGTTVVNFFAYADRVLTAFSPLSSSTNRRPARTQHTLVDRVLVELGTAPH